MQLTFSIDKSCGAKKLNYYQEKAYLDLQRLSGTLFQQGLFYSTSTKLLSFRIGFFSSTVQELLFLMLHTSETSFISVHKVQRKAKMKKGLQESECLPFQSVVLSSTNPMYQQLGKKPTRLVLFRHTVYDVILRIHL